MFGGALFPTFGGDKKLLIYCLNITLVLDSLDTLETGSVLIFLRVLQQGGGGKLLPIHSLK